MIMSNIQWPRCNSCRKAADVKPDESGRLWASCCGLRTAIRLAFVPSDARPMKLGEGKNRAVSR